MWQTELGVTVNLNNQDWNVFLQNRKMETSSCITAGLQTTMILAPSWIYGTRPMETTTLSTPTDYDAAIDAKKLPPTSGRAYESIPRS